MLISQFENDKFVGADQCVCPCYFKVPMFSKPFVLYCLIISLLTLTGALILAMPAMCLPQQHISFIDALFTAASAVTLTGLHTLEPGKTFSMAGQAVILLLFQISALFIVISALYFAYILKIKTGIIPQNKVLKNISARVLFLTLIIELPAVIAVFSLWGRRLDVGGTGMQIFYSVFHAVSAFTNTGFTLFEGGFAHPALKDMYILHLALAAFMFFGALGFPAIYDLISIRKLRERMVSPQKDWELNTKVSFYGGFILALTGAILFYILENDDLLRTQKMVEAGISSLFHSVSLRSSGFSVFNVPDFLPVLQLIVLVFIFIGGSSASFAGGIKVSTVYLLFSGKSGSKKSLIKVLIISILLITIISILLHFSERQHTYFSLLFETVSAFGSAGFSLDVTPTLSDFGKILIIICMLSGRILFPGVIFHGLSNQKEELNHEVIVG